jgi:5'-3' exonuclease
MSTNIEFSKDYKDSIFSESICKFNETVAHKLDLKKNICLVDLSYLTFTRYFAMRIWYKNAHPDKDLPDDYDYFNDEIFLEKFNLLFHKKLYQICQSLCVPKENIIYGVDCHHNNNWRVIANKDYKGTRAESHVKNNFSNFEIFPHVRNNVVKPVQDELGNIMLYHPNLEADDVLALFHNYLRENKKYKKNIYVIANDKDYIQLNYPKTFIVDINNKFISEKHLQPYEEFIKKEKLNESNPEITASIMFLLAKILMGDVSDNIPPCMISIKFLKEHGLIKSSKKEYSKCSKSIINKLLFNNNTLLELYNCLLETRKCLLQNKTLSQTQTEIFENNQFYLNAKFIDFSNIPKQYQIKMNKIYDCLLSL